METRYFYETKKISFFCSDYNGGIYVEIFDKNLESTNSSFKQFTTCQTIYGFSVLYSEVFDDYYVLSDVSCNGNSNSFLSLSAQYNNITNEDIEEEKEEEEEKEDEEKEVE